MKDKVKGLIIGLAVGSLITGATAFAAGGKMIEVFYNVKDIKVNQVSKMPKGTQQPFIYNGSTFVPLAFVGEALGQPVKWDAQNRTVLIGETGEASAAYPKNGIEEMNQQGGRGANVRYEYQGKEIKDNVGNVYTNYIAYYIWNFWPESGWVYNEFPLNGQFKKFKATIGLTNEYKNTTATSTVSIIADGVEKYSTTLKAGDMPTQMEVDLTNAVKVQIKVTNSGEETAEIGLFNAYFIK